MKRGRPSPGGGGKAGGSAAKSKSITSFFFKAPSKADADGGDGRGGVDGGTATAPSDAPDASPPTAEATPAAKRRREDAGADAVTADTRETPDVSAQKPHTDAAPSRMSAEEVLEAIGPSDPDRHAKFVEKLGRRFIPREGGRVYERAGIEGDDGDAGEANDADADADEDDNRGKNNRGKKSSSSKASSSVAKLTPLETQVKKCKADHPGVLLLI